MPDPRSDAIAREAARLIQTGSSNDIDDALHRAAVALGYPTAPFPSANRVRKHAQAMSMQAMGDAAYHEQRIKVWEIAEQIMTVFEHTMPDVQCLLAGRAAEGHIDAGVTIHIRVYTRRSDQELASALIEFGYDELQFRSTLSRFGRLQQIHFAEDDYDIALTRCMPDTFAESRRDVVTGNPIETLNLIALRRQIENARQ